MSRLQAGLSGAWEFIVGDDWRVALGVVTAIALTALVATSTVAAWWVLPVGVVALLADSLRRACAPGATALVGRLGTLASERSLEPARPFGDLPQQDPHLLESRPQFGVADLDRQHRILEPGECAVGPSDRLDRAVDDPLRVVCADVRRLRGERPAGKAVAVGEPCMDALSAPVGELNRPEELLLEALGGVVVEAARRPRPGS